MCASQTFNYYIRITPSGYCLLSISFKGYIIQSQTIDPLFMLFQVAQDISSVSLPNLGHAVGANADYVLRVTGKGTIPYPPRVPKQTLIEHPLPRGLIAHGPQLHCLIS